MNKKNTLTCKEVQLLLFLFCVMCKFFTERSDTNLQTNARPKPKPLQIHQGLFRFHQS